MSSTLLSRFRNDNLLEIGVDEAGRGSFWGPIVAGAVILPNETGWTDEQRHVFMQLKDSKKISPKKREKIADLLRKCLSTCGIGMVSSKDINENGIQWANVEAFRRAIKEVYSGDDSEARLIVDGTLKISDWKGEQEVIIEADNHYIAVAGASILAKVAHDRWIEKYCQEYPECNERYDLFKNKGYGTLKHREGIKLYGGHYLHRELYIQRWVSTSLNSNKPKKSIKNTKCLIQFSFESKHVDDEKTI